MFSETTIARDIFGPLWGIVELGAVAASDSGPLRDVSLARFVAAHRDTLDGLLELVREIGDFQPGTMDIFEESGWEDRRDVATTTAYLMLWSGAIEAFPPDIDDPTVVRRMVATGSDLQLTEFMHALVGAARVRGPGLERAVGLIVEAVGRAGLLLGRTDRRVPQDTFRMWRVAHLPRLLRPDSPATDAAKVALRGYAHALEDVVTPAA
ncbi:hypothetical protein [Streptomyces sp. NPDC127098]|uniref:hypothetical protein n=1 Tax=Streptomyces sp. NPDC127098 TaxID=3347137 RepID=UPI00365A6B88